MMKFKTKRLRQAWHFTPVPHNSPQEKLRRAIRLFDEISRLTGHGEITITSFIRKKKTSYHYKAQAIDFRTKDKTARWYLAMLYIGQQLQNLDPTIQLDPHLNLRNKPNEHFHLEIDDGSI